MDSKKFADKLMPFLEKHNKYTDKERIVVHYGLETLYVNISKAIIITIFSLFLGITLEMYCFIFVYGLLRTYMGGIHLKTSLGCTVYSGTIFIISTILSLNLDIFLQIGIFIILIGLFIAYKYSPADTSRKPILNKDLRKRRKKISCMLISIYLIIYILNINSILNNFIVFAVLINSILIHPITYKLMKQNYNNYLVYEKMKKEVA